MTKIDDKTLENIAGAGDNQDVVLKIDRNPYAPNDKPDNGSTNPPQDDGPQGSTEPGDSTQEVWF